MGSELFGEAIYARRAASDWRDAVDVAGRIWLEKGACEQKYINLIKRQLAENNAYAVIIPGLVLLHATSGYGVRENSLMLITLAEPVPFGHEENDPVKVMICFTSLGQNDHIDSMQRIARMLFDPDLVEKFWAAGSDEALKALVLEMERCND
ncbi:MAG TPA: PTS sugar transporter subunit IIA [Pseudoflavonifractor sp.]|nr:PTS sugar transporter subunit IIA [Pseudoflavonifractor sp.]